MWTNRLSRMLKRVQCTHMTIGMKHSPLSGPSYLPISSSLIFFYFTPKILSPELTAKGASSIDWPRVSPIVVGGQSLGGVKRINKREAAIWTV